VLGAFRTAHLVMHPTLRPDHLVREARLLVLRAEDPAVDVATASVLGEEANISEL
jgi:hypothetical protein